MAYLTNDLPRGVSPSELFDARCYAAILRDGQFDEAEINGNAVMHYLEFGASANISPNNIVDLAGYLEANPDLETCHLLFRHLITSGIYEGRRIRSPRAPTMAIEIPPAPDLQAACLLNWDRFWGMRGKGRACWRVLAGAEDSQARFDALLADAEIARMIARAVQLDPAVGGKSRQVYTAPPYHDLHEVSRKAIRQRLLHTHYDTVICVPWLRMGGADLIACHLAVAAAKAEPGGRVIILRTDSSAFDCPPSWAPPWIECVDISSELTPLGMAAEFVLYATLVRLSPRRVINVNSRTLWRTTVRFGERLKMSTNIYSYLFCWDQLEDGSLVGYPSEYFASAAPCLAGTFIDSAFLGNELTRIYSPPKSIQDNVHVLLTPALVEAPPETAAAQSLARAPHRLRPQLFWAGRFDRQKRFDLVLAIANRMPDVDILAWGSGVLDQAEFQELPGNVALRGRYDDLSEVPLADAELLLFTSEWEGTPTILVELGVRGVAIVASAVGGVPELIDDTTGWPVRPYDAVDEYVNAIRAAINDPVARVARASALQARVMARHTAESYLTAIAAIFAKEAVK